MNRPTKAFFAAIALTPIVTCEANAVSHSVTTEDFVIDPTGDYLVGAFDFGTSFVEIERVSVEITSTQGISEPFCTGSYCAVSYLTLQLFDPASPTEPRVYIPGTIGEPYPELFASFLSLRPGQPSITQISPPNARTELGIVELGMGEMATTNILHDPWPDFLLNGSGAVRLQVLSQWGCYLNCTGGGVNVGAPLGGFTLRLIVDGIATPEPTTTLLFVAGGVLTLCNTGRLPRGRKTTYQRVVHSNPCSSAGKVPARTSSRYWVTARVISVFRSANGLTNFGT